MTEDDPPRLSGRSEAGAAEERAELIAWLEQEGYTSAQIDRAVSPLLLPANRVFGDDGDVVSAQAIADAAGVPIGLVLRLLDAIDLPIREDPGQPVYTRADAESILPAASLIGLGIDPDQVLVVVRLLVTGLTQGAVAMRFAGLTTILNPGVRERQLAWDLQLLAEESKPFIDSMITELSARTLRRSFAVDAITLAERSAGRLTTVRTVSIAFADVVGFTRLSEELPLEELTHVVDVLVDATRELITEPIRFAKTIGDAVMLVSPDAGQLVSVVLDLLEHVAASRLQLRAGVATGTAMNRSGDWYGQPVNIASRVADVAPPGVVWVAESKRDSAATRSDVVFTHATTRRLRGVVAAANIFAAARKGNG